MLMSMKFGIALPQGWPLLSGIKDPVEAYETMTRAAHIAEECGYESIWLADHLMPTESRCNYANKQAKKANYSSVL